MIQNHQNMPMTFSSSDFGQSPHAISQTGRPNPKIKKRSDIGRTLPSLANFWLRP